MNRNDKTKNKEENDSLVDKSLQFIHEGYRLIGGIIYPPVIGTMNLIERGKVSKKISVWAGIGLTVYTMGWAMNFAENAPDGMGPNGIAAVIAAILGPIAGLTSFLMKFGEQDVVIKSEKKSISTNRDNVED